MPVDNMYGTPTLQLLTVPQYVAELGIQLETAYRHVQEQIGHNLRGRRNFMTTEPYKV